MPWKTPLGKPLGERQTPPKESAHRRGYGREWQRIQKLFKQTHPLCEECGDWTTEIDHVDGNNRNNDPGNLKALCSACHRRKTTENRRRYGHG